MGSLRNGRTRKCHSKRTVPRLEAALKIVRACTKENGMGDFRLPAYYGRNNFAVIRKGHVIMGDTGQ